MGQPDSLEEAAARLAMALDAFEEAVTRRFGDSPADDALTARLRALEAEHERVRETLGAERRRAESLQSANEEVAVRLDAIIDRVRTILQHG